MAAMVGDRVTVQPKSVHAPERTGTVEAVLSASAPRYQVRWDDGRWSIIAPTDGVLRVLSQPSRTKPLPRRRATTAKEPA
jgi:multidrug resistance efflux pump